METSSNEPIVTLPICRRPGPIVCRKVDVDDVTKNNNNDDDVQVDDAVIQRKQFKFQQMPQGQQQGQQQGHQQQHQNQNQIQGQNQQIQQRQEYPRSSIPKSKPQNDYIYVSFSRK